MNGEPWIPNVPGPVRPKPSFVDRHLGFAVRVVVIGLAVLIVKPWTFGAGGDIAATPTLAPKPAPTERSGPHGFDDLAYDPAVFGTREPTPHWDLWPAAYLVTYSFVIQLGGPSATAVPVPIGSPAPVTLPPAAASPSPPADGGPTWPSSVRVPAGYHVFVVGIDMPPNTNLMSKQLSREDLSGSLPIEVPLSDQPSPWPDHFVAFGIPAAADADRLQTWQPGIYRLDLMFQHIDTVSTWHAIRRSIEIIIEALPEAPTTTPTTTPAS